LPKEEQVKKATGQQKEQQVKKEKASERKPFF